MPLNHQPFDGTEETIDSHLISKKELQAVLKAIEEEQFVDATHSISPYDDWVTIESICEATGHRPHEVAQILYEHRRAELASRISDRLRELEEPLYRVERPGHHKPNSSMPGLRVEQVNTILDRLLPKQNYINRKKSLEANLSDRIATAFAIIIGGVVILVTVALVIQAALSR